MSKKELQRRELTNTLNITSVTSAMALLGLAPVYYPNMVEEHGVKTTTGCIAFKVESSSKYFSVPPTFKIPLESSLGKCMKMSLRISIYGVHYVFLLIKSFWSDY
jgi:hypothetical protein